MCLGTSRRVADVLEQTYKRAVVLKVAGGLKDSEHRGRGSHKLGLGHHDQAKRREDGDAQPNTPHAQQALLGDGHYEPRRLSNLATDADGDDGLLDSHDAYQGVVAEVVLK